MNELSTTVKQLPDNLEDLTRFDENGAPIFFDELSTNELLELLISLQRES